MADNIYMNTPTTTGANMYTIWVINGDTRALIALGMALNSQELLAPITEPHPIAGDILGVVSGTTDEGDNWVSVRDCSDARKLLFDFTGAVPRKSFRVEVGD